MGKTVKINFDSDTITSQAQLEKTSEMGIDDVKNFHSSFFFKPGLLSTDLNENELKPVAVSGSPSGSVTISSGTAVANDGSFIEVDTNKTINLVLNDYVDKTLFVKYITASSSDLQTLVPLTGLQRNVSIVKDQDVDNIFFWVDSYTPSGDSELGTYSNSVPLGKLTYDGAYDFKINDGFRRLALPKIPYIGKGHYASEITPSANAGSSSLYEFLASVGHGDQDDNNPFGLSVRDITSLLDTFKTSIYKGGIPAFDFTADDNKYMLKVTDNGGGNARVHPGKIIDDNGHYIDIPTAVTLAIPADSVIYTVYLVYKVVGDKDSYELSFSVTPSSDSFEIATVKRLIGEDDITIVDKRTPLCYYHKKVVTPQKPLRLRLGWGYRADESLDNHVLAIWGDYIISSTIDATRHTIEIVESWMKTNDLKIPYVVDELVDQYIYYTLTSGGSIVEYYSKITANTSNTITVETAISIDYTYGAYSIVPEKEGEIKIHIQGLKEGASFGTITKISHDDGNPATEPEKIYNHVLPFPAGSRYVATDWTCAGGWAVGDINFEKMIDKSSNDIMGKCVNWGDYYNPKQYYRVRIASCLDINASWWSDWTDWVIISPKTPSEAMEDTCIPKDDDFHPIQTTQGGLNVLRKGFTDLRKYGAGGTALSIEYDGLARYFSKMELSWTKVHSPTLGDVLAVDDVTVSTVEALSIPPEEVPGDPVMVDAVVDISENINYIKAPVTSFFIPVNPAEVLWIKVRYVAKDGTVSASKTLNRDGTLSDSKPIGGNVPKSYASKQKYMVSETGYPKISSTEIALWDATAVALSSAEGAYSTLNDRMVAFDDIRERAELAITPTGKINPAAIDEDSLAAMLIRVDNIPSEEITDAKIKTLSASKVSGVLTVANLPSVTMSADSTGSNGGVLIKAGVSIGTGTYVDTSISGFTSTPEYVYFVPTNQYGFLVYEVKGSRSSTNIRLHNTGGGTATVDLYVR